MIFLLPLGACFLNCIEGSGNVVSQEEELNFFNEVKVAGMGEVFLIKGKENGIRVETDDNLMERIVVEQNGDELKIKTKGCILERKSLKFFVTLSELKELDISGSAVVSSKDFFETNNFELDISGSGRANLKLGANNVNVDISGSGDAELEGSSKGLDLNISGSGGFSGKAFQVRDADVEISGSGGASLFVSNYLNADISGSGDLYYKGRPSVEADVSGSGKIHKLNK